MHDSYLHDERSKNRILASLCEREYSLLKPYLETVNLSLGKKIYSCGDAIEYLYFPLDAVICLYTLMENGATVEAGVVGSEGFLGVSALLGVEKMPMQSLTLNTSRAVRIKTDVVKQELENCGRLQTAILRYIHALYFQISQIAACNRIHSTEHRLCRWLLMTHDRTQRDELKVTQEFISQMLGTRRPYITIAAGILHRKKIIYCHRGHIKILDRQRLEKYACECYGIIWDESKIVH